MRVSLTDAINELRDDLRTAIRDGEGQDIVFTPRGVELELAITFGSEAKAGGGVKLLAFLDLSAEGKLTDSSQHKVKLILDVTDKEGKPLQIRSSKLPAGF